MKSFAFAVEMRLMMYLLIYGSVSFVFEKMLMDLNFGKLALANRCWNCRDFCV